MLKWEWQKWQYLEIRITLELNRVQTIRVNGFYPNNDAKNTDHYKYLDKLGAEGWELVSMRFIEDGGKGEGTGSGHHFYYFKRLIPLGL